MSVRRASCAHADPQLTKRLFAIIVLMIGLICIFGGYLLGRMARNDVKRNSDLLTFNLTTVTYNLYKKAKRISPKAIHNLDPDKIRMKLTQILDCVHVSCSNVDKYNLAEFIRTSVNLQVIKIMQSVHNASIYLDSLR